MKLKIFIIVSFLGLSSIVTCQSVPDVNKTDQQGRKQGHWIKKDPNGIILYDGIFKDDHPVGEFKRYYENGTLISLLIYSDDGNEAIATIYHPNGYISSKGKFISQKKEGKWQFFSANISEYLISEEYYTLNQRNGISLKFYPDSTLLEKVKYINNVKEGEWLQYYPSGKLWVRSNYLNGKVNGKFEVWFENGQVQFSGQYKNDVRDGLWQIYNNDGVLRYKMEYREGFTKDHQMDIDESDFMDSLELNKGNVPDPEKIGIIR